MRPAVLALAMGACVIPDVQEVKLTNPDGCIRECSDGVVICSTTITLQRELCACGQEHQYVTPECDALCVDEVGPYMTECLNDVLDCIADCVEKVKDAL